MADEGEDNIEDNCSNIHRLIGAQFVCSLADRES